MVTPRGILDPEAIGRMFTLERPAPPAALADLVEHHWLVTWDLRGRPPFYSEVLPHPCVHLVVEPGRTAVYGVMRGRFERRLTGRGWALGTKFHPGGFRPFTDGPVATLTDRVLDLPTVFGAAGTRRAARLAACRTPHDALALVQAFLAERRAALAPGADPDRERVRRIAADILAAPPGERVADIARRHHVSPRTLQRLFATYVGIGPKWVAQRYRLHDALEEMQSPADTDWARFAVELGYYDQAHFLRDFRALVGRTPDQYERERRSRMAAAA